MENDNILSVCADMFKNIVFCKKEDFEGNSIYVAKIMNMSTSSHCQYIILVCALNRRDKALYKNLIVKSIQTRKLPSYYFYNCIPISWKPSKSGYSIELKAQSRTNAQTNYVHDSENLQVMLFHDAKKKDVTGKISIYQYPNKLSLLACLETFACVIDLKITQEEENFIFL